jgi:hypothetical protein
MKYTILDIIDAIAFGVSFLIICAWCGVLAYVIVLLLIALFSFLSSYLDVIGWKLMIALFISFCVIWTLVRIDV